METGEGVGIQDLVDILRRRRELIIYTAGGIFLLSIFVASVLPNEYVSYATVHVQPQTIADSLVEAAQEDTDLTNRLNLMATEILSRSRLSRIIDELDLYPEQSLTMTREEVIQMMRSYIRVEPVVPEFETENVRREVQITTFMIFFRDRHPRTAAVVADKLANDFVDEHLKARTQVSGDTSEFMEGELVRLARGIQQIEERVAQVKSENTGSLPEDMGSNQELLRRAYDKLRDAERELAEAQANEAFYRHQAVAASTFENPTDRISPEQRLEQLELLLSEYESRGYTEKHPDVIASSREVQALRSSLLAKASGDADPEGPTSLAEQTAEAEARRASLTAGAVTQEIERIRAQIEEFGQRLARTPRVAEQLDALDRQYRHLYESYQNYSSKRLQAAVAANMELQVKGERFRVLESAVPPLDPTSPNRPLVIVVGLLVGLAAAGGLAILMEGMDRSYRSARQLAQALQLPVLAAIPGILLEQDRARRRRKRMRALVLSSLFTGVVLVGSFAGNWWVNGVPGIVQNFLEGESGPGAAPAPEAGAEG
jgi:polysaccharide chain length determinant protein (PEP-CTERM system associated)